PMTPPYLMRPGQDYFLFLELGAWDVYWVLAHPQDPNAVIVTTGNGSLLLPNGTGGYAPATEVSAVSAAHVGKVRFLSCPQDASPSPSLVVTASPSPSPSPSPSLSPSPSPS